MKRTTEPEAVPVFANEAAEKAWWETHDSAGHVDWSKAQRASFPNLKPSESRSATGPSAAAVPSASEMAGKV